MAKTTKIKTVASVLACQSKDQVMDFIRQIVTNSVKLSVSKLA